MENNNGYGNFEERFGRMGVRGEEEAFSNDNSNNLFQVMKAVEAAEATIKQQVEENNRLRNELYKKEGILEKIKLEEATARQSHSAGKWDEYKMHHAGISASNLDSRVRSIGDSAGADTRGALALQHVPTPNSDAPAIRADEEKYAPASKTNGTLKVMSAGQVHADNAGLSQLSSPSTTSLSAGGYHSEGEHDPRLNLSGHAMMQMSGVNNPSSLWKQDLSLKTRAYEEEIMILRKRVTEYSMKEAQLHNEKYVLEKRIAHMRLAFDQQQQDLVDAASKALSYRQDIIEENIRLTYALQSAQEDRSTYVSSLLPILAEYSLQPQVPDAPSIVSNLKVLLKHFQEKLNLTEAKLKESQYQLTPWHSDTNPSNVASQSPSHSLGTALTTSNKNGLELVPQSAYSEDMGLIPSKGQTTTDWDVVGQNQNTLGGLVTQNLGSDDSGRFQPIASRPRKGNDPTQHLVTQGETRTTSFSEEPSGKQVTFSDNVSTSEIDHPDTEGIQNERESPATWRQGGSTYAHDDPGSYSPYLPPVLEEPSSSFSEAADDDPLPAIEGLQITGYPYPGHSLQACGYSINGTTSCNFEWVRHWEDGSVNYIEGAKQPNYLVTADDVNAYLAIEVQPLDNRKRKGELVKVFANEHQKISCEPEMHTLIEKALLSGHASFKVSLSTGYLDIFEPATLAIKREGFSIKYSGPSNVVVTEKFSASTTVTIPYGQTEFLITGSGGVEHFLRAEGDPADVSCSRETIVLILRYFISRVYGLTAKQVMRNRK